MVFDFQINEDVKFKKNPYLLGKAEENKPQLLKRMIQPVNLVEIKKDEGGVRVKDTALTMEQLSSTPLKKQQKIIFDLGDHYVGKFSVMIRSFGSPMDAPLHLRLKFAEVPIELVSDPDEYDGWLSSSWIFEEYLHLDVLPHRLELPRRYSCRYIEIEVLDTSPKYSVIFEEPLFQMQSAVSLEEVASLDLEDELLDQIDKISLKTLQDCMQTVFEDGPKRDQRLWLGDLRLQAQANMLTFQNKEIVRRCLYLFGGMPTEDGKIPANVFIRPEYIPDDTFLFDYSLFFTNTLLDYYQFSKEQQILSDLYPVAKKSIELALGYVALDGELRFDEQWPFFIDWSDEWDKQTASYGIMIYSLKAAIALSELQHDLAFSEKLMEKLHLLEGYVLNNLFSREVGLFISGDQKEVNLISQVWMVLAGVLSEEQAQEVMSKTILRFAPIRGIATPYMYHHITEALFVTNLQDEAIDLIKNYWGKMAQLGADTFWEAFMPEDLSFSPYGNPLVNSYCHAWSCTPCYLFRKYL